jgi:putative NADPH-quinone reductase
MKVLAIVAHPKLEGSRLHRPWAEALETSPNISVRPLYKFYPNWKIDVPSEQEALTIHDRIVLQFPFYLYGCPPLLKKWLDDVLAFRWAYGPGGSTLNGKELLIATSTGGPAESYQSGGYHKYTVDELLIPFRQIANLIGARYLRPYVRHRARSINDSEIATSAADYLRYVLGERTEVPPVGSGRHPSR